MVGEEGPAVIRVALTDAQRDELRARTREAGIAPRTRDRLEMVRLADAGWTIPRIARHLSAARADRAQVRQGVPGRRLRRPARPAASRSPADRHRGPPRRAARPCSTLAGGPGRRGSWSAWLEREHGVRVHPDHLSRLLHARRFGWKRTVTSVAHKRRDPDGYDAKVAELEALKKRPRPG